MNRNESRARGLNRLANLRHENRETGEQMEELAGRFETLAGKTAKTRAVSAFNLFQTPPAIAETLAQIFPRFRRTLEPSAGLGRLYRAVRAIDETAEIVLVERSPDCCRELYEAIDGDGSAKLLQGDFLEKTPEEIGLFNSIIMNPPFCRGDDMRHIEHARKFLAPGGRLAAICAAGPRQIRKYTEEEAFEFHHLPPDSFKSEGTSVSTAIVIIDN